MNQVKFEKREYRRDYHDAPLTPNDVTTCGLCLRKMKGYCITEHLKTHGAGYVSGIIWKSKD